MRNLKRALSLTLASVMLLGMMVVGSSAAAGYDDVAETDNVEAIEVLQAIEVMVGDERGFGPDRPVNRAEMAVVMGKLLNLDYNYYSTSCPFNDVYDWARGYVGACAARKIVSGRGEGVYDPGATVTAVEAASMLMRALGYFQYANDVADGFELSTVRQGTTIGIFDGVGSSATEPMTRNQVAQMVLNALQSGMVQPDGNTINLTTPDGSVYTGKVNYVYITSNKPFAQSISSVNATSMGSTNDNPIVELGEQLYNGELKLYDKQIDVFGRPARIWEYKGNEIGTYVKKELLKQEYTKKVTGQDLYDLLSKNTIEEYRFRIYVDGVATTDNNAKNILAASGAWFDKSDLYRTNKDGVGGTGKGVLTQVFVDTDYTNPQLYTVYINIINTYLAKASEDYDTKNDDVKMDVYAIDDSVQTKVYAKRNPDSPASIVETFTVDGDDFDVKEVKEDDIYLVRVADSEIQEMVKPEIISNATINAFSRRDWVNLDGTQYDYASTARYDVEVLFKYDNPNLKDVTYNVILDKYGYAIGLERNEDPDQYVFLTGIEDSFSNLTTRQVDANVIHLDGTMETVKVDMKESFTSGKNWNVNEPSQANIWCTYRVDSSNVYTLECVPTSILQSDGVTKNDAAQWSTDVKAGQPAREIDQKHISLPSGATTTSVAYGNDKTVYLNVDLDEVPVKDYVAANTQYRRIIDDVNSVVVGHKNVKTTVSNVSDADKEGDAWTASSTGNKYIAPEKEIYTLFDDDNYIIAVVTIGEDEGVSSNWAYVYSNKVKSEAYNGNTTKAANDGKWTWSREVIVDGKKTEIKYVGDHLRYIGTSASDGNMQRGDWYEIKYNADGTVRKAVALDVKLDKNIAADGYVNDIKSVAEAVTKKDTVLLADEVHVENLAFNEQGTLYVENDVTKGFAVSPDVKVVLALAGKVANGRPLFDTVDDGDVYYGYNGLRDALRDMNIKYAKNNWTNSWANVELHAILKNNAAEVIIIRDDNAAPDNKVVIDDTTQTGNGTVKLHSSLSNVGSILNDSVSIAANGRTSATFTLVKPEWAYAINSADNDTVEVEYDIYMDGVFYTTAAAKLQNDGDGDGDQALSHNTAGTQYTAKNLLITNNTDLANSDVKDRDGTLHNISLVITDVNWKQAKVEFYDNNNRKLPMDYGSSATTEYLTTASTGAQIKFKVVTNDATTGIKYDIQNVNGVANAATTGLTASNALGNAVQSTTGSYYANGNGIVKVVFKPTAPVALTYKIGAQGADADLSATTMTALQAAPNNIPVTGLPTGSADANATLAVTRPAATATEGTVGGYYTLTIGSHADGVVTAFEVDYTLTGCSEATSSGTVTIKDLGGASSETVYIGTVLGNVDLTVTAIRVKTMSFLVKGATVSTDETKAIISFSENAVRLSPDYGQNGNVIDVKYDGSTSDNSATAVVNNDGTVTVTLSSSNKFTTGATIRIDAPVVNAAGQQVKAATITLTKNATTGVWTANVVNK